MFSEVQIPKILRSFCNWSDLLRSAKIAPIILESSACSKSIFLLLEHYSSTFKNVYDFHSTFAGRKEMAHAFWQILAGIFCCPLHLQTESCLPSASGWWVNIKAHLLISAWWNLALPVIILGEELLWDKHYLYAKKANRKIKIMHCWGHQLLHHFSSSYIQWEGQFQDQHMDHLRELLSIFIPNT